MKCLDTYALIEIAEGNEKFTKYFNEEFVIANETLAEFFWVILRDRNEEEAYFWYKKLENYSETVPLHILINAMKFRRDNRKKNLSFFDCVGYLFALDKNIKFVTGDEGFEEGLPNVEYMKGLDKNKER